MDRTAERPHATLIVIITAALLIMTQLVPATAGQTPEPTPEPDLIGPLVEDVATSYITSRRGTEITVASPAGVGRLLVAHVVSPKVSEAPDGWEQVAHLVHREHSSVFVRVLEDATDEPPTYTFRQDGNSGRIGVGLARISHADLEDPFDVVDSLQLAGPSDGKYPAPDVTVEGPSRLLMHLWGTGDDVGQLETPDELTAWWSFGSAARLRSSLAMATQSRHQGQVSGVTATGPDVSTSRYSHTLVINPSPDSTAVPDPGQPDQEPAPQPEPEPEPEPEADPEPAPEPEPEPEPSGGELEGASTAEFEETPIGSHADIELALTNVGASDVSLDGVTFDGSDAFSVYTAVEGQRLVPGDWTTLTVRFAPQIVGIHDATMEVRHSGRNSPFTVALRGEASAQQAGPDDSAPVIAFAAAPAGCRGTCGTTSVIHAVLGQEDETTQVSEPGSGAADHHPRWSPDGTHLAYTRIMAGGRGEIRVVGLAGGSFSSDRQLTSTADAHDGVGCSGTEMVPVWSPTSAYVAYTCAAAYGRSEIGTVSTDGAHQTWLGAPNRVADAGPTWSPTGNSLAFTRLDTSVAFGRPGRSTLWISDFEGGQVSRSRQVVGGQAAVIQSVWSPDGERLLYVARDERTLDLSLRSLSLTDDVQEIHFTVAGSERSGLGSPAWSPGASRIVFTVGNGLDSSRVMTIDLATGMVSGVSAPDVMAFAPSWGPTDAHVVFDTLSADDTGADQRIVIAAAAGGTSNPFTPSTLHAFDAAWRSPR